MAVASAAAPQPNCMDPLSDRSDKSDESDMSDKSLKSGGCFNSGASHSGFWLLYSQCHDQSGSAFSQYLCDVPVIFAMR